MPKNFRRMGGDQQVILARALTAMKMASESLEIVRASRYPEEISDKIVGFETRRAIEALNTVRNEWGFDDVGPGELAEPSTPVVG